MSAKHTYGKSRAKFFNHKGLSARCRAAGRLSLQPVAQPPRGAAAGIDWRPLTLAGGGPIKAGTPILARPRRHGSGKPECYGQTPCYSTGTAPQDRRPNSGRPRAEAAIVAALADRHPKDDVRRTLMRLDVTKQLVETGGRYTLPAGEAKQD
jgi:hypothetical protein